MRCSRRLNQDLGRPNLTHVCMRTWFEFRSLYRHIIGRTPIRTSQMDCGSIDFFELSPTFQASLTLVVDMTGRRGTDAVNALPWLREVLLSRQCQESLWMRRSWRDGCRDVARNDQVLQLAMAGTDRSWHPVPIQQITWL